MGLQRFARPFFTCCAVLSLVGAALFFLRGNHPSPYLAQNTNTYLGPNQKVPGNPTLIRVQVLVYNDPNLNGVEILKAEFDGTSIPLKPRDVYGFRGQASFQKRAGKYKLRWEVQRDSKSWPRTVSHEEEVTLDSRDLWLQITITGDSAEIS